MELVLLASVGVLAYTFLGYPALAWLLARWFPRPVARAAIQPRIAIIVVARNEAARITRKIESCLALDYPRDRMRVIVASDGSDDGTNELVAACGPPVSLLAFGHRRGKAACLNDAIAHCEEEIVVLTDARQPLDREAARMLVENFADPDVGAASGELVFETEGMTGFGEGVDAYWRYEKFIRRQESAFASAVGVTGALYALRRECFREIAPDTILDDVAIPMNVVLSGRRVVFEDRARARDLPSREPAQERARKIRTIAGNYQLALANPALLLPWRNPLFVQFVSHKLLRLLAPFAMAALLVSNIALAPGSAAYQTLLAAQVVAYAIPALGLLAPAARRWKLVNVATAFVLLNAYAVLGLVEFVRNRNAHLWGSEPRGSAKGPQT